MVVSRFQILSVIDIEVSTLLTSLKRSNQYAWGGGHIESNRMSVISNLQKSLEDLRSILTNFPKNYDLKHFEPSTFLNPFLNIIRSEVVTGSVTEIALISVNKFLSYGIIECWLGDIGADNIAQSRNIVAIAVESLTDAVTHTRISTSDSVSNEVILLGIMEVLRSLMKSSSLSVLLSNESVCEIFQTSLRICFEYRLSDVLRRGCQYCLQEMIRIIFYRLNDLVDQGVNNISVENGGNIVKFGCLFSKRLKVHGVNDPRNKNGRKKHMLKKDKDQAYVGNADLSCVKSLKKELDTEENKANHETKKEKQSAVPIQEECVSFNVDTDVLARSPIGSVVDLERYDGFNELSSFSAPSGLQDETQLQEGVEVESSAESNKEMHRNETVGENSIDTSLSNSKFITTENTEEINSKVENNSKCDQKSLVSNISSESEFVNSQGVTFVSRAEKSSTDDPHYHIVVPYGIDSIAEIFHFLTSVLQHPTASTDGLYSDDLASKIRIALSLIATSVETSCNLLSKFPILVDLVRDNLAKGILNVISSQRVDIFASSLWIWYLVQNDVALRRHTKFQLEMFLDRIIDIIESSDSTGSASFERREKSVEFILRIFRMPHGYVSQLFLNFDCDIYASNIVQRLITVLSKTAFPLNGSLYSIHLLCFEALLAVNKGIKDRDRIMTPSSLNLRALKREKEAVEIATSRFNANPSQGIFYLTEVGLLEQTSTSNYAHGVAQFLRNNPHLDKKQVGEFIAGRKNLAVLEAFVGSFDYTGIRIDECLRQFLETFRLPGEAPQISVIIEHFSAHWFACNPSGGLHDADAAFTLSYAIIMLNVDQHNTNHTKLNDPMNEEQFMRNLRGTNGPNGGNHSSQMLSDIFHAIQNEEIVMPFEQGGAVKQEYLWKCILRRGLSTFSEESEEATQHVFEIVWGPTVAVIAYVFEATPVENEEVLFRALQGYETCAEISATFGLVKAIDNICSTLCKFVLVPLSGANFMSGSNTEGFSVKSRLAIHKLFALVRLHGHLLVDGWKPFIEILLHLFAHRLLPDTMMKSDDFVCDRGWIWLYEGIENDTNSSITATTSPVPPSFLNSFVSFISGGPASGLTDGSQNNLSSHRKKRLTKARQVISAALKDDNDDAELIFSASKLYPLNSLRILMTQIIELELQTHQTNPSSSILATDGASMFLTEILVVITIHNRDRVAEIWPLIFDCLSRQVLHGKWKCFSIGVLFRLAERLGRREDMTHVIVRSLGVLLKINPANHATVSRHVIFGLHELVRNNAANIHSASDWSIVFNLLEVFGAGISTGSFEGEWELLSCQEQAISTEVVNLRSTEVVDGAGTGTGTGSNWHDVKSFIKACQSLAFLLRDAAHVTPQNFEHCVSTLGKFTETVLCRKPVVETQCSPTEMALAIQLLDLMYALYCSPPLEGAISPSADWSSLCWFPLMQSMTRLCGDIRTSVCMAAFTTLQRALLFPELRKELNAQQWEKVFNLIIFPMLECFLEIRSPMEETKTRAINILGKIFLQNLLVLSSNLELLIRLWIKILDFMERFLSRAASDSLCEAVPESLKNLLLVMHTAKLLDANSSNLWRLTKEKIDSFLPHLMEDVFGSTAVEQISDKAAPFAHYSSPIKVLEPGGDASSSSLVSTSTFSYYLPPSSGNILTQPFVPNLVSPIFLTAASVKDSTIKSVPR